MNRLTVSLLTKIKDELNEKIKNSFITHISVISSQDIIFSFSFYKKEKLLLSLNHNSPFVALIESKENFPTMVSQTNEILRKYLTNAYIIDISQKENDRVLVLTLKKNNELFEKETYYLIFELIPFKANLLLLDENKKIIFATHYTSFDSKRVINKGILYEEIESSLRGEEKDIDLANYKNEALRYLDNAKEKRRKDQYSHLFKSIKNRIKTLNKKLDILNEGIIKAEEQLSYVDMGNLLYSIEDESEIDELISQRLLKDYDKDKSIKDNASIYFKKYKKAKSTIEHHQIELLRAKDEIEDNERIYLQLENGDDTDLLELKTTLNISKGKKDNSKTNKKNKISPLFIKINNNKIAFGKTDNQNYILTFEKAHPHDEFFHIKDYPGSHVVLMGNDFTNTEREMAAELALLLSKKDSGEVQHALIKDVKKGDRLGKVNLRSYTTIYISKVKDETKEMLLKAIRM